MVKLFILTKGMSSNFISKFLSIKKINNFFFKNSMSDYKIFSIIDIENCNINLRDKGYYLMENFLDNRGEDVDEIKSYLAKCKGMYISDSFLNKEKYNLDIENPKAIQFRYDSFDLINCHIVQNLLTNSKILQVANNYLESTPILDEISCWWSFPSEKPDLNSAQLWHFDMDRPKWLKVFIFLTDCAKNSGPHCYIPKTHKNNSIPDEILKKGYSRIDDQLIYKLFPKQDIMTFTAKKGAILFEDTRGLHKGQNVQSGNRLVLQLQYSSAIFGSKTKKLSFPKTPTKQFLDRKKNFPDLFINFQ
jgi:ectoine hydroxylase-related dioxygenase (phytanoyl-CoA dioxygenase family)